MMLLSLNDFFLAVVEASLVTCHLDLESQNSSLTKLAMTKIWYRPVSNQANDKIFLFS